MKTNCIKPKVEKTHTPGVNSLNSQVKLFIPTKPAAKSIPASDKNAGLTAIMKESVKNVLIPAIISVLKLVFLSSSLKILFKIYSRLSNIVSKKDVTNLRQIKLTLFETLSKII